MLTKEKLQSVLLILVDGMDSWQLIEELKNHFTKEEIIELGFEREWNTVEEDGNEDIWGNPLPTEPEKMIMHRTEILCIECMKKKLIHEKGLELYCDNCGTRFEFIDETFTVYSYKND